MKNWVGICIHHSLSKDGVARDWDAITKYHMSYRHNGNIISKEKFEELKAKGAKGLEKPWVANGYHAGIERINGEVRILQGRSTEMNGAHCPELNASHLGICVVGNFDLAPPDDELLTALQQQCEAWMQKYPISLRSVTYHCDHSQKTCPGKLFPKTGFLLALAGEERP